MHQRDESPHKNNNPNSQEPEEIKIRHRPSLFPIRHSARRKASYS